MILEPLYDNVILKIKEVEKEQTLGNGLVYANEALSQVRDDKGEVIAVGHGRLSTNGEIVELKVKAGDKVLFNKFAGTEMEIDNEKYLIIKESDILAIMKSE